MYMLVETKSYSTSILYASEEGETLEVFKQKINQWLIDNDLIFNKDAEINWECVVAICPIIEEE